MDDKDDYRYLKLNDAVFCIHQKVSLIGVILEVGCYMENRGSDSFSALTIIDESYSQAGIPVNFSADSMEKLPRIASIGDIILLSHVMILHVCEILNSEWMAFVWDGTDTRPAFIHSKLKNEREDELPLNLEPFRLSKDILCSFPAVGSILRLIIDRDIEKHILHFLNAGKWVKMLNVHVKVNAGLWCGLLTHFTRLRYLPDEDFLILERQRSFGNRMSMKYPRLPYWCFPWTSGVTELDCNNRVPFATLMDVLTYSKVAAKYRCVVRVVAAFPCRAEDLLCNSGRYGLRLTLEDPTARIHAFVYAEDGVKLFDGYPPIDAVQQKLNKLLGVVVTNEGMEDKNAPRNPPWVQFCLMSYYLDKNDQWGSRNYRISMTKIVG
ncbi:protection of telomeres protein 1b isoform X3 [Mangifera indica]|uniref:protection of telomeres protein 1b isoform X3 n=1 Tax=Mangifera indica TaxID=29780 RepID=UPI001CFAED1F|nr:protection of telomeres protein 1b isoform X3 [Mangifera indica]